MENLKPPEYLNLEAPNLAEEWRRWKHSWDIYSLASGVSQKDEKIQCAVFLHVAGPGAQQVNDNFKYNDDQKDKIKPMTEQFDAYCEPRRNETYERYIFHTTVQNKRSFDVFLTDLKVKVKQCGFGDLMDSMIRDQIVLGIDDNSLRERLLREADLTLEQASKHGRAAEQSKLQLKNLTISSTLGAEADTHSISQRTNSKKKPFKKRSHLTQYHKFNDKESDYAKCYKCGWKKHEPDERCPAIGAKCRKCGRRNHYAKFCKTHQTDEVAVNESSNEDSDEDDSLFTDEIEIDSVSTIITSNVLIEKTVEVSFKVDTGSACNVIPEEIYKKLNRVSLKPTNKQLIAYGGAKLPVIGKCRLKVKVGKRRIKACFYVVRLKSQALLSLETSLKLGLITLSELVGIHSIQQAQHNKNTDVLLDKYDDVFKGLGCVEGEYDIKLDENVQPTIQPPRKVPLSIKPKLKKKLDTLISRGIISPVDHPTDWVNSLVIVQKKDGTLRLCLDPPDLNKAIKREFYRPPSPEAISSALNGMKVFTVVDMSDCYWHKKLTEKSALLCTFNTPFGRMRFNRMPFGICCASDVAQKMVDGHFSDLPGVLPIHDDIIIGGKNTIEHDENLERVLQRAKERNIKFNKRKIQFRVPQVKYMGELVGESGFTPDPDKIVAIQNFPRPHDRESVQRLLGMVNFVSRYIPNMSSITKPIRSLLQKDIMWQWNEEQEAALNTIRKILCEEPILKFYDIDKDLILQVDASLNGLGACLLQDNRPIAYASRSLTPAEENYANIERELLAIVYAVERFHQYTFGRKVIIQTDHKPLESIHTKPLGKTPPRLQKLLLRLQRYQLDVKWVPGTMIKFADALSRAPLPNKISVLTKDDQDDIELMVNNITQNLPLSPWRIETLQRINETDHMFQKLHYYCKHGWPTSRKNVPVEFHRFWNIRADLYVQDRILTFNNRLVIPEIWKPEMLKKLHISHSGVEKTKTRARQSIYWPGIDHNNRKCSLLRST